MRDKVRNLDFVMTFHAEEEMENDNFSILDVENGILTGEIVERQKDSETIKWKYLIAGRTLVDDKIIIAAKLSSSDKLVIITVYLEDYGFKN